MKLVLLAGLCVLFASFAQASEMRSEAIQTQQIEEASGMYTLNDVCVYSTNYNTMKASQFCEGNANAVNLMTTNSVMMAASCNPASASTHLNCYYKNGYIMRTRMSIAK